MRCRVALAAAAFAAGAAANTAAAAHDQFAGVPFVHRKRPGSANPAAGRDAHPAAAVHPAAADPAYAGPKGRKPLRADRLAWCPTTLNKTTWSERRKAVPKVHWRAAIPADMVVGKVGTLIGQDSNLKWWPIVLRQRNPDGTFFADVIDGTGETWEKVWVSYVKAKFIQQPTQEWETVVHSGCTSFPAECGPRLGVDALRGADAACLRDLQPAVWDHLTTAQTRRLSPAVIGAIPAPSCASMGGLAAAGLPCTAPLSDACAAALTEDAVAALEAPCVARLSSAAFAGFSADQVTAVIKGAGAQALRTTQFAALSNDGCGGFIHEIAAVKDLGDHGASLCLAVPQRCWATEEARNQLSVEELPTGCLTKLPENTLRMLANMNPEKREGKVWCAHGAEVLAQAMSAKQRATIPVEACDTCLRTAGVSSLFPQCGGPHLRQGWAKALGGGGGSGWEWLVVAAAATAAFAAGVALQRRTAATAEYASVP